MGNRPCFHHGHRAVAERHPVGSNGAQAHRGARKHSSAFGLLVEIAAVTGARVSQLARIEVQDLQADRTEPRLIVPTSRKERGTKKVLRRAVPIPGRLAERLRTLAVDRLPTAPLLARPSGAP